MNRSEEGFSLERTTNKNLTQFIKAINDDASTACEKIMKEAEDYRKNEITSLKAKLYEETKLKTQNGIDKFQNGYNKGLSEIETKLKSELIEKRNSIEKAVFEEVSKKIEVFTATDEYRLFLIKSAVKIGEALKGENLEIFMREKDMAFADEIKKSLNGRCTVTKDDTIILGGLKASTEKFTADDTLDGRLKNEAEYFRANSGLSIV